LRSCCGALKDVGAGERRDHHIRRAAEQLIGGPDLHKAAEVDHTDPLGESGGIIEGVGHEQRREAELREDAGEFVAHLAPGDCVQRAERLVEQQHARLSGYGPRERCALALTAREIAGSCAGEMLDAEATVFRSLPGLLGMSPDREAAAAGIVLGHAAECL